MKRKVARGRMKRKVQGGALREITDCAERAARYPADHLEFRR